jgi:Cu+-exporting ATPase
MDLEPVTVAAEEDNSEVRAMSRRFWISAALTVPLVILAMGHMIEQLPIKDWIPGHVMPWLQFVLATPVVLWGGWPFFKRGYKSIVTWNLNMFTLIAIGTGVAYVYSLVATIAPQIFPEAFRNEHGNVDLYYESAAVIIALVLMGQMLELKARGRTNSAIRSLLELAPATAHRINDEGQEEDISIE